MDKFGKTYSYDFNESYDLISHVRAEIGNNILRLGVGRGVCRFCGRDGDIFKNKSHFIPEALGNKWVFQSDECDNCNQKFSRNEDSLVKALKPILAISGTRGKDNKLRQAGSSKLGPSIRRASNGNSGGSVVLFQRNVKSFAEVIPNDVLNSITSGNLSPKDSFVPRNLYKALCKIGIGMLPDNELSKFKKLKEWILLKNDLDNYEFNRLNVILKINSSFFGNGVLSCSLLRRKDLMFVPYCIFIMSIGPICIIIDLMSDSDDNHISFIEHNWLKINHQYKIGDIKENVIIKHDVEFIFNASSKYKVDNLFEDIRINVKNSMNSGDLIFQLNKSLE